MVKQLMFLKIASKFINLSKERGTVGHGGGGGGGGGLQLPTPPGSDPDLS